MINGLLRHLAFIISLLLSVWLGLIRHYELPFGTANEVEWFKKLFNILKLCSVIIKILYVINKYYIKYKINVILKYYFNLVHIFQCSQVIVYKNNRSIIKKTDAIFLVH